jgi:hypothetical protein
MKRAGTAAFAAVALISCVGISGCGRRFEESPADRQVAKPQTMTALPVPGGEMPGWLDLYKKKNLVDVATVDHVVIVTFETLGRRDDVFGHYSAKFSGEENFVSFRDNRDIISFLKDGYGVKITLLDPSRNIWSLEYHKPLI